jgi:hypothetical protein
MVAFYIRFLTCASLIVIISAASYGQTAIKVPAFFMADSLKKGDTTYQMTFYYRHPAKVKDASRRDSTYEAVPPHRRDSNVYQWQNFGEVKFVSVFRKYIDYAHHYTNGDGKELPLPVATIVQRYERSGTNRWIFVDYPRKQFIELKEFPDEIVRRDTVRAAGTSPVIYEYYKVAETP